MVPFRYYKFCVAHPTSSRCVLNRMVQLANTVSMMEILFNFEVLLNFCCSTGVYVFQISLHCSSNSFCVQHCHLVADFVVISR